MKRSNDDDKLIRESFEKMRRAERDSAPAFGRVREIEASQDAGTTTKRRPALVWISALATASLAVGVLSFIALRSLEESPGGPVATQTPPQSVHDSAAPVTTQALPQPARDSAVGVSVAPATENPPAVGEDKAALTEILVAEEASVPPDVHMTIDVPQPLVVVATETPSASPAEQPTTTYAITGGLVALVMDEEGQPLPGATVTISHAGGAVRTTASLTNKKGEAPYPVLRPGEGYALEAEFPGHSRVRITDLTVERGNLDKVTFQLPGTITEALLVEAEPDIVRFESTQAATVFSEAFVADLPATGEDYQDAVALAPGVGDADGDGNPNVHGGRSRDFSTMAAGVSNVDPLTGRYMARVNPNSVEELEVITAGVGVEMSRASGSFANKFGKKSSNLEIESEDWNTESYATIQENGFTTVAASPLSTFSIDVDTASYANVRRFLRAGNLPPPDAVRIEELINYFSYDYVGPTDATPFAVNVEIADCPWNSEHRLARIGLKGREVVDRGSNGSNLVFLIDVSGSMNSSNKLRLVKRALALLVDQLDGRDRVSMVVYAGASGLVLPPTSGDRKNEIIDAIDSLSAGGSTNGGQGLSLAYRLARDNYIPGGTNRVILATDGDFNVGVTSHGELLRLIKEDARNGIFLTTLGVGMGNYKDDTLELLADKGNGNYAYIDSLQEARKVLVDELAGTLVTIAKDVKIQVEFNPLQVAGYRLIGYENRMLEQEDFNDDRKDAGEIGAGHTVTALYELVPRGKSVPAAKVDPLRYQAAGPTTEAENGEMFTLKLRYKEPEDQTSAKLEFPVFDEGLKLTGASRDFQFASAVALFGMVLRDSDQRNGAGPELCRKLADLGLGHDARGYRAEFLTLLERAEALYAESAGEGTD